VSEYYKNLIQTVYDLNYEKIKAKSKFDGAVQKIIEKESKKPIKKCLLSSCGKDTIHNGGYCSAECCKQDNLYMVLIKCNVV